MNGRKGEGKGKNRMGMFSLLISLKLFEKSSCGNMCEFLCWFNFLRLYFIFIVTTKTLISSVRTTKEMSYMNLKKKMRFL
jgi:hypothetical protein